MWTWKFYFTNSVQTNRVTFLESFVKLGGRDPHRLEDTPATDTPVFPLARMSGEVRVRDRSCAVPAVLIAISHFSSITLF